jgi:hypothetical protein
MGYYLQEHFRVELHGRNMEEGGDVLHITADQDNAMQHRIVISQQKKYSGETWYCNTVLAYMNHSLKKKNVPSEFCFLG